MPQSRWVLFWLAGLSSIAFLDRLCIAVASPRIERDLGIAPAAWGWVLGAMAIAYGLFEIPSGALGDRKGHHKILTRIALWWGGFTALTGLASGFRSLCITQFFFGAGEAGAYPNISGLLERWFPPERRAHAQGWIWAASRIGATLAPLVLVPMQAAWGWRASFWILGLLGFAWALGWHAWYREPQAAPAFAEPELSAAASPASPPTRNVQAGIPWRKILQHRQVRWIAMMYGCYAWGSWFYFSWFPTYLVRGHHLTLREMSLASAFPFLLGMLGNLLGGRCGDWLCRRYGLKIGRRMTGATALSVAGLLLLAAGLSHGPAASVALLALAFGAMDFMLPTAWAVCLDVGGPYSATISGMMNTAGLAGGFICTVLFGYDVRASGNYNTPILVIAAMVLASAALFLQIDPTRPLTTQPTEMALQAD